LSKSVAERSPDAPLPGEVALGAAIIKWHNNFQAKPATVLASSLDPVR
jgi:hypothetical protein